MQKKTSLKDIAQVVGVSTTLVSYVLNNQKENRISKEVAKRIRQVAKDLNYQPNQIAKSLKTSKTRTLGLLVADIANPFFSAMARIVEDEANQQNYTVIFGSSDENAQKGEKLLTTLLNRQVDGLLIAPSAGMEDQLADIQKNGTPFVLLDRYFPDLKTSYVALDNYQAMYSATQHLIDAGYRRIALITLDTPLFTIQERTRGYRAALADNAIAERKSWLRVVDPMTGKPDVDRAIHELATGARPVEALIFTTNTLTLYGLKRIKSLAIRVPDDVAVVGFDETEAYDLFYVSPTYIRQPLLEMGQLATRILLETLATPHRISQANLPASLVIQASTRPVPSPSKP